MINFVSHLPPDLRSGGFSAMNCAAYTAIKQRYVMHYVGPISIAPDVDQKGYSKLRRILGLPGSFHQYSERSLKKIARQVNQASEVDADLDFFHGFTPWVATKPVRPFVAWSDCTFRDYLAIYHRLKDFDKDDIARIVDSEALWLSRARRIAFTSNWAAENALRDYNLDPRRVDVVGIFGEVNPPDHDAYNGGVDFAFISTNFDAKGGPVVLAALQLVRNQWPDSRLIIIGDAPKALAHERGVIITGFLRKEDIDQNQKFRGILSQVRAVVHPTRSDIAPLLLVEAALFGCPVVASRRFAIPEIVEDSVTGILVDDPTNVNSVAAAMAKLLECDEKYLQMRQMAWKKGRSELSREKFALRLRSFVEISLKRDD